MPEGSQPLFTNYRTGKPIPAVTAIGTASITNAQLAGPIVTSAAGTASITNAQLAGPIVAIIGTASIGNSQLAGPIVALIGTASITASQITGLPTFTVIASGSVTNTANLDIPIDDQDWDEVRIKLWNIRPDTDNVSMTVRFAVGGSFLAGADYTYACITAANHFASNGVNAITIAGGTSDGIGNAADEYSWFDCVIFKPTKSSFVKAIQAVGGSTGTDGAINTTNATGRIITTAATVQDVRFRFNSGSIAEAFYQAVGVIYA